MPISSGPLALLLGALSIVAVLVGAWLGILSGIAALILAAYSMIRGSRLLGAIGAVLGLLGMGMGLGLGLVSLLLGAFEEAGGFTEPGFVRVGLKEPANLDGLVLTVDSCEKVLSVAEAEGEGYRVYGADPASEFVVVRATLKNPTPKPQRLRAVWGIVLLTQEGGSYERIDRHELRGLSWRASAKPPSVCDHLDLTSSLVPGETRSGCLLFKIKRGETPNIILLKEALFVGKVVEVSLECSKSQLLEHQAQGL